MCCVQECGLYLQTCEALGSNSYRKHFLENQPDYHTKRGFPGGSEVKASASNAGNLGSIPGSGRSPGEGNGNLLQYSYLENSMERGAWWSTVHEVTKSWTQLSN